MSTHTHTIARNATKTGSATLPDPPSLAGYATTTALKAVSDAAAVLKTAIMTEQTDREAADVAITGGSTVTIANAVLRILALEGHITPPAATVPGAPTGVSAFAGNGQATVSFTAPATGGSPITGYTVTGTPSGTATGTASPIVVTGLTNGTAYTFTVTATNAVGTGAASSASGSVTPAAITVPGAPTIGVATAGNAQATVAFSAPSSNGGSPITGYTVTSTPGSRTASGSASPIVVTGLTNGTAYTFTAHATNAIGNSAESSASGSVTPSAGLTRPWAAPTTTATYSVPGTITHDGSADASAALNTFLGTVPDGSVVNFPLGAAATYRLDHGLIVSGRNNLIFQSNGATLHANGSGGTYSDSPFELRASHHISILGFNIVCNNPNTTTIYNPGTENMMAVSIDSQTGNGPSTYIEIGNNTISHTYGEAVYIEGLTSSPYTPSDSIWIHDNSGTYLGRNAIALIDATNVLIEANNFDKVGGSMLDIEPNFAGQTVGYVTMRNNTLGVYGLTTAGVAWFVSDAQIGSGIGCNVHDVTITGNTVVGIAAEGYGDGPRGLNLRFEGSSGQHHTNITVTGNSTAQAAIGPVMYFSYVDTATVTGNTQPLVSGSVYGDDGNCTGITHQ